MNVARKGAENAKNWNCLSYLTFSEPLREK